jgi:hypothetical protein
MALKLDAYKARLVEAARQFASARDEGLPTAVEQEKLLRSLGYIK